LSEWIVSRRARAGLQRVEQALLDATDVADHGMRELAWQLILRGGKRIRPTLLLVASELGRGDEEALISAAVIVELMHVASLYHDDVIDRAPLRRGALSVNRRWGNALATVGGTFLIARALAIAAALGDEVNRLTTTAVADLCGGELQEIENGFDVDLPEETHFQILERKTATLFVLPCALAARISRSGKKVTRALGDYATHVGLAFQLADDALDLMAHTRVLGKRAGSDLREGSYSLAVLRAVRAAQSIAVPLRDLLARESLTDRELRQAMRLIRASGAIDSALHSAREHVAQALGALAVLPAGPAAESLARFASLAVERSA
jgi:heptaprenyl diphosphate synthase